jgi:hypothetical protein
LKLRGARKGLEKGRCPLCSEDEYTKNNTVYVYYQMFGYEEVEATTVE